MGKRSSFERVERDFYPTPLEAVHPLLPHLNESSRFIECCAGDGRLIQHLEAAGHSCVSAFDIAPQAEGIAVKDALHTTSTDVIHTDYIITNPPWTRTFLHRFIEHYVHLNKPTWLLFDAEWAHTKQSAPYMQHVARIVSVGRVKWIPNSKHTSKDSCAWYLFKSNAQLTEFYGREHV